MSTPCVPQPCALHVLVARGDADRPDLSGLLSTLGDRLGDLDVVTVPGVDGRIDLATLRLAAEVVDDLRLHVGRARYVEHAGDLGDLLQRDVERGLRPLVVVPAGSPRRTVRAVRRATQAVAAHVAVVPACAPTVEARR